MSVSSTINQAASFLAHSNVDEYKRNSSGDIVEDSVAQRRRMRDDILNKMKTKPTEFHIERTGEVYDVQTLPNEYKTDLGYIPFYPELPPGLEMINDYRGQANLEYKDPKRGNVKKSFTKHFRKPRPARVTFNGAHGAPGTADQPVGTQFADYTPNAGQMKDAPFLVSFSDDPQTAGVRITDIKWGHDGGRRASIRIPARATWAPRRTTDENYQSAPKRVSLARGPFHHDVVPPELQSHNTLKATGCPLFCLELRMREVNPGFEDPKLRNQDMVDSVTIGTTREAPVGMPGGYAVADPEYAVRRDDQDMEDPYRGPGRQPIIDGVPPEHLDRILKEKKWNTEGEFAIYKFMTSRQINFWLMYPSEGNSENANRWLDIRAESWTKMMLYIADWGDHWFVKSNGLEWMSDASLVTLPAYLTGIVAPINRSLVRQWRIWKVAGLKFAVPKLWDGHQPLGRLADDEETAQVEQALQCVGKHMSDRMWFFSAFCHPDYHHGCVIDKVRYTDNSYRIKLDSDRRMKVPSGSVLPGVGTELTITVREQSGDVRIFQCIVDRAELHMRGLGMVLLLQATLLDPRPFNDSRHRTKKVEIIRLVVPSDDLKHELDTIRCRTRSSLRRSQYTGDVSDVA